MPPRTRRATQDVIVVHDSDSDVDSDSRKHTSKWQKTGSGTCCIACFDAFQAHILEGSRARTSTSLSDEDDDRMDVDDPVPRPVKHKEVHKPDKNAHLKGRKRFVADLADMREECGSKDGFEVNGLRVSSECFVVERVLDPHPL